jgi:tetratricopeptide (TPR) repeat protein
MIHAGWGQHDKAVSSYEKSLATCRELKDRKGEATSVMNVGRALQLRGEHNKALEHFQKGLAINTEIKLPTRWPKALMADTYLDTGDLAGAEPLLKEANHNSRWGRFYLLKTDYPKAKEHYGKILKSAEENRNAENFFTAYTGLGAACEGMKDDAAAVEYYEKAVKHTEDLRTSLAAAEREKFFDVKINGFFRTAPYEGLARTLLRQNRPQEAFKTTEYTRAGVFAEAMTRMGQGKNLAVPADIISQDTSLNNELAGLKKSLQKAFEKNNKQAVQSLEPQVKQAEAKLQAHIRTLRDKYPLFAATKYPEPMELSQAGLKDNEWALSFDVTDPGVIVYLTKGKTLEYAGFKPIKREDLDAMVRKFREQMEMPDGRIETSRLAAFDLALGKKLADLLLSEALQRLPKDTAVIVAPDDCRGELPFETLVLNGGGKVDKSGSIPTVTGAEFFGDRNPISYTQSVTDLTLARTFGSKGSTGRKTLVMDDPVFSLEDARVRKAETDRKERTLEALPQNIMSIKNELGISFSRLPLTAKLGASLKKLDSGSTDEHSGFDASKQRLFKTPLKDYRTVVFATHGYAGTDLPGVMEPSLILTLVDQPKDQDGFLRLSEVMGLKLNADIAALTACQTGLGKRISGEGTMSLGRAFQYAGAKTVLMSLWSVSEQASVDMVESFFRNVKEGKPKLEALRLARQEIRAKGYDHPYFWAPFILVGETQ